LRAKWRLQRRYEPRMSDDEREWLYSRWKIAVERSKHWAHEAVDSPLT
ncbi:MAG: hypothetical protein H0V53_01040, partial [Rubrobacter sp.]|nr:hypothetical protein [Rubrobacter sp.]MBA2440980.1 hypothetical protein [Rubrobacter sp.]